MSSFGYILLGIAKILGIITFTYKLVVIASAITTWVNADPYNPIVKTLRQLTEPVYAKIRPKLPRFLFRTGLDFTPLIVLLGLILIEEVVINILRDWGRSFF